VVIVPNRINAELRNVMRSEGVDVAQVARLADQDGTGHLWAVLTREPPTELHGRVSVMHTDVLKQAGQVKSKEERFLILLLSADSVRRQMQELQAMTPAEREKRIQEDRERRERDRERLGREKLDEEIERYRRIKGDPGQTVERRSGGWSFGHKIGRFVGNLIKRRT
jgi:hypothetical protein